MSMYSFFLVFGRMVNKKADLNLKVYSYYTKIVKNANFVIY